MYLIIAISTPAASDTSLRNASVAGDGQQQLATQTSANVANLVQTNAQSKQPSIPHFNISSSESAVTTVPAEQTMPSTTQAGRHVPVYPLQTSTTTQTADISVKNTYQADFSPNSEQFTSQTEVLPSNAGAPIPSHTSTGSYPVYYLSNPEETSALQDPLGPNVNVTINFQGPRIPSANNTLQTVDKNTYPVYYVGFEKGTQKQSDDKVAKKTSSLPLSTSTTKVMNTHTEGYPVYYVTSAEKVAEPPNTPSRNISISFEHKSFTNHTSVANVPVYKVGGPTVEDDGKVSISKGVPDSPISYEIINKSSVLQDATAMDNRSNPSSAETTLFGPLSANASTSSPSSPPAIFPYNSSYQDYQSLYETSSSPSPQSTYQKDYNYFGSPANPPSPVAYQSPLPASQPVHNNNIYVTNQAAPAPSSVQPSTNLTTVYSDQVKRPVESTAPASAPVLPPVPNPSVISGVSSSPPYPPASNSPSPIDGGSQLAHPTAHSNNSKPTENANEIILPEFKLSSLPNLESDYENASYIIATPPEKDTVLFLPPPSFPMSAQFTKNENVSSTGPQTSSTTGNSSSQEVLEQPKSIAIPSLISNHSARVNNSTSFLPPSLNTSSVEEPVDESSIIRIPENMTFPEWELENTTFSNVTSMSNTSTGPSYVATPAISPTLAAQPSDISDIPLGPLLNSLAVTKPPLSMKPTKPPLLHLLKTSSPKPAPAQETTKPTYVTVSPTTRPTAKNPKKWGFGDKYLGKESIICLKVSTERNNRELKQGRQQRQLRHQKTII